MQFKLTESPKQRAKNIVDAKIAHDKQVTESEIARVRGILNSKRQPIQVFLESNSELYKKLQDAESKLNTHLDEIKKISSKIIRLNEIDTYRSLLVKEKKPSSQKEILDALDKAKSDSFIQEAFIKYKRVNKITELTTEEESQILIAVRSELNSQLTRLNRDTASYENKYEEAKQALYWMVELLSSQVLKASGIPLKTFYEYIKAKKDSMALPPYFIPPTSTQREAAIREETTKQEFIQNLKKLLGKINGLSNKEIKDKVYSFFLDQAYQSVRISFSQLEEIINSAELKSVIPIIIPIIIKEKKIRNLLLCMLNNVNANRTLISLLENSLKVQLKINNQDSGAATVTLKPVQPISITDSDSTTRGINTLTRSNLDHIEKIESNSTSKSKELYTMASPELNTSFDPSASLRSVSSNSFSYSRRSDTSGSTSPQTDIDPILEFSETSSIRPVRSDSTSSILHRLDSINDTPQSPISDFINNSASSDPTITPIHKSDSIISSSLDISSTSIDITESGTLSPVSSVSNIPSTISPPASASLRTSIPFNFGSDDTSVSSMENFGEIFVKHYERTIQNHLDYIKDCGVKLISYKATDYNLEEVESLETSVREKQVKYRTFLPDYLNPIIGDAPFKLKTARFMFRTSRHTIPYWLTKITDFLGKIKDSENNNAQYLSFLFDKVGIKLYNHQINSIFLAARNANASDDSQLNKDNQPN